MVAVHRAVGKCPWAPTERWHGDVRGHSPVFPCFVWARCIHLWTRSASARRGDGGAIAKGSDLGDALGTKLPSMKRVTTSMPGGTLDPMLFPLSI